jgi:hypothetical protein
MFDPSTLPSPSRGKGVQRDCCNGFSTRRHGR